MRDQMNSRHEFENYQNWSTRGFLPHYDAANKYQMITYRLADSLPVSSPGTTGGPPVDALKHRKMIESTLDKGYGSCVLKRSSYS